MTVSALGVGAGSAELAEQPNVLRLFIGETVSRRVEVPLEEDIVMLEANLDDMNPQIYGYFVERVLEAGALDVYATAIQMKKNRPGQMVTILCDSGRREILLDLLFRETTTLGVKQSRVQRRTLQRESLTVETRYGSVAVKVGRLNGHVLSVAPEYEDCKNVALQRGVPLKEVLAEAMFQFRKANWTEK